MVGEREETENLIQRYAFERTSRRPDGGVKLSDKLILPPYNMQSLSKGLPSFSHTKILFEFEAIQGNSCP